MGSKVVLVTGANQGLGFAIVQAAALRDPTSSYILCSRNSDAGKAAIQKLQDAGVTAKVDLVQLEATNDDQIAAAVKYMEDTYGKLDVLVNNAGILRGPPQGHLADVRKTYTDALSVNLTSVAVVTHAFMPLLYKSTDPKVISITSGLGSMTNALTKKMGRSPPYGASKIGLNGFSVHMQVAENDRVEAERDEPSGEPRIRFYVHQPGLLRTAFTRFHPAGKSPEEGAEGAVRLMMDDKHTYEGGTFWECVDGEMKQVPW